MDEQLLDLFATFLEKQDIVIKLTSQPFIHEYGHSELHCLAAIAQLTQANVTTISQLLNITRGAASKITKRLLKRGDLTCYQNPGNKKEVYFRLTEQGQQTNRAHTQRHAIWRARDLAFLQTLPAVEKAVVCNFFQHFNHYLQVKIEEMEHENTGGKDYGIF